jgi:hypothetical protein
MSYSTLEQIRIRLDEYEVTENGGEETITFPKNLKLDTKLNELILKAKQDIKHHRHYPDGYTEEQIENDIENKYHSMVIDLVLYDYATDGMEFETNHSETGVNRTIVKKETLLGKIIPFCKVL